MMTNKQGTKIVNPMTLGQEFLWYGVAMSYGKNAVEAIAQKVWVQL